jgi:peptidoglycan/xylan/chitin deacetylase (PgdA/CDA1 family)
LLAGPESTLRAAVAHLVTLARIDSLALTRLLCLRWDELRLLAADPAVTIGAHSLTHPMLAKHPFEFAAREMLESKVRIEFELGRKVAHFAYPVGDKGSAGPREFQMARDAGFASAVTTRPGHLFAEHAGHLHALPRLSLNGHHQNDEALKSLLSGLPFWGLNRGRRLNVD